MFTATSSQIVTYLVVVCLFSISFLVFVNASVSFVVTTIIGQTENVGDKVGTLGFADEIVVILTCPLWGILSDHVGARPVCVMAFAIVGVALGLFVQARNVFPQMLLIRLLFSFGAAGTSTMITAILPAIVATHDDQVAGCATSVQNDPEVVASISSEPIATPISTSDPRNLAIESSPTRFAALVGIFSGIGALLALLVFLRVPEFIQRNGTDSVNALKDSYYIVGGIALFLSVVCNYGLKNLQGESEKGWKAFLQPRHGNKEARPQGLYLLQAMTLPIHIPPLGLAYLGGFVARASSIGITLFIPLLVNTYFISTGLCDDLENDPTNIKQTCRSAYVLSSELTGVSQLLGLVFAPLFGFLADRYPRSNLLLLLAAFAGSLGYFSLTTLKSPKASGIDGSRWIFVIMALLGINQVGLIICSLGLFSRCVLGLQTDLRTVSRGRPDYEDDVTQCARDTDAPVEDRRIQESTPLIGNGGPLRNLQHLKGSIAGVYSLSGGVGILLLTKLGGALFDKAPSAPFIMLSLFNALLLVVGIICGFAPVWQRQVV